MQQDALFHIWQGDGHVPVAEIAVSWPLDPSEAVRVLVVPHLSEPGLRFVFGGRHPGASLIPEVADRQLRWLNAAATADASAARDAFFPVDETLFHGNANIFATAAPLAVYAATLEPTELRFDLWAANQLVPTGTDLADLVLRHLASAAIDAQLEVGRKPPPPPSTLSGGTPAADGISEQSELWARQALELLDLIDRTTRVANSIQTVNARASRDQALLLDAVAALRRQLPLDGLTTLCIVDHDFPDEDLRWLLRAHLTGSNPGLPTGNDIRGLLREFRRQVDTHNSEAGN